MFRNMDGFEEFGVPPWTADILGRAASLGFDQARIERAWLGIDQPFDLDGVLPAVPEVVEIAQCFDADVFEHVSKPGFARVKEIAAPVGAGIGYASSDIAGADPVEMTVGPAHRGLDRQMQAIEPDGIRYLDTAQNHGRDVIEGDLEASDGVGNHAATLRPPLSAAQCHGSRSWSRPCGMPAIRASTSASQACGSTSLSFAA